MDIKLKTIRELKSLSTYEAAHKMGITQSAYIRLERNETKIDLDRLKLFADAMEMSLIDVLMYPEQYVNVKEIANELRKNEPDVIVQIKVKEKQRESVLKVLLGDLYNVDLLK